MRHKLCSIFRSCSVQLKDIAKELLPQGKRELLLFVFLSIFYLSYSLFLGLETSLVSNAHRGMDLYFSFDNVVHFNAGFQNLDAHPFLQIFSYPFTFVGNILSKYVGIEARIILFLLCCTTSVTMSVVYINRYLRRIVELSDRVSLLISVFFALFSTLLVLAFTVESFTWSLFMLSFWVYYFSKKIKEQARVGFFSYAVSVFILGGVTITNAVKAGCAIFFFKDTLKNKMRLVKNTIVLFAVALLFVGYYSLDFSRLEYFDDVSNLPLSEKIINYFWGSPILLSSLCIGNSRVGEINNTYMQMISLQSYSHWWQYAVVLLILAIVVFSLVKNYRTKLVQYLFLLLFFDVLLHIVLMKGLSEAMIYGGHWVYTIPLFVGWLYKSLEKNQRKILIAVLSGLILILAVNDVVRMKEFTDLAFQYFPKSDSLMIHR